MLYYSFCCCIFRTISYEIQEDGWRGSLLWHSYIRNILKVLTCAFKFPFCYSSERMKCPAKLCYLIAHPWFCIWLKSLALIQHIQILSQGVVRMFSPSLRGEQQANLTDSLSNGKKNNGGLVRTWCLLVPLLWQTWIGNFHFVQSIYTK